MPKENIGERIFSLRKARGWSQRKLGEIAEGISHSTICLYEKGEGKPDNRNTIKLAKALDVTVSYLLTGEEQPSVDLPEELVDAWQKADPAGKGVLLYLTKEMIEKYKGFLEGSSAFAPAAVFLNEPTGRRFPAYETQPGQAVALCQSCP